MSASDGFVRVLRSTELAAREGLETELREVRVGGERVLMGRLKSGQVVAFGASCPHEMTDLRDATFVDGTIRCPRHNYMYDPHSGANVIPTAITRRENLWKLHPGYLPTRQVEEHDGWVWVSATPNPRPEGWDPAVEAPPARSTRRGAPPATAPAPQAASEAASEAAARGVPVERAPKRLRVRLGKEFELRLPMAATPAHTWRIDVPEGLLAVVEQRYEPASPPHQRVRIAARALGQGTLRCSFGRPWVPEPEEIRTYTVEVVLV